MGKQPTYQELLAAYNKLLMENQHLREKIGELQTLLGSKNNSTTPLAIERHLSLEEKVDTAGQAENPATSLYAGTNGTGNYVTRKSISVRNVPTGHLNRWSMRISTGISKGKTLTVRT